MQTRYKMQTENLYCLFVWYVIICHLTTYRVSRNRFSATIFYDYLHDVEYSQPVSWSQTFLFQAWCLYRIHQLDKRGCRCKWGVTIEYLTRAIFEKQLTALHVVHKFHLFNRYVFAKNADRDQNCSLDLIYFQRSGVFTHWFSHMCLILLLAYTRNRRIFVGKNGVTFVTSLLFTFQVVLSLIWLVTTKILISENQTIWRLEILLRTIVAALLKTKCNGRFVKNKRYPETGKEYFRIVWMIVKDEDYIYFAARATFDARSCPPSPSSAPQIRHTNQQEGHCLSDDLCPSHLLPTQPYFQFP